MQKIEFDELLAFIIEQQKYLNKMQSRDDLRLIALANITKLTEEVGELANEVLHSLKMQRQSKLSTKQAKNTDLADEVADVIIVALLIADTFGEDAQIALRKKVDAVIARRVSNN